MENKYFSVRGTETCCGIEYPVKEVVMAKNAFEAAKEVALLYSGNLESGIDDDEIELTMSGYPILETENGDVYIEATNEILKSQFELWKKLEIEIFYNSIQE